MLDEMKRRHAADITSHDSQDDTPDAA
jgi:hypothetical protein